MISTARHLAFFRGEIMMQIELVEEKLKRIEGRYKKQAQEDWYDMEEEQIKEKIEEVDKQYQTYRNLWRKLIGYTSEFI
jgi:DNA-binding transcriptional regulator GbsR (MarR family)